MVLLGCKYRSYLNSSGISMLYFTLRCLYVPNISKQKAEDNLCFLFYFPVIMISPLIHQINYYAGIVTHNAGRTPEVS